MRKKQGLSTVHKVGVVVMMFFLILGVAWFVREVIAGGTEVSFWQVYVSSFAAVYGVFAGIDWGKKHSKSKYYRPEMDDEHPEVQAAAIARGKPNEID